MPTGSQESCKPDAALQIWKALVWGRWSMVDWFDSNDRRFVLALPISARIIDGTTTLAGMSVDVKLQLYAQSHNQATTTLELPVAAVSGGDHPHWLRHERLAREARRR